MTEVTLSWIKLWKHLNQGGVIAGLVVVVGILQSYMLENGSAQGSSNKFDDHE